MKKPSAARPVRSVAFVGNGRAVRVAVRVVGLAVLLASPAIVAQAQKRPPDLSFMSVEDLMQVEVTSVAKKQEKLARTPAAIYVITQEDIRRSGATSIPELLRMVPGLDVARLDGSTWAISSRGFNDRFSNKLLVLIDGRTVYDPLFSGVNWDLQDTLLEDIERIEVIRGPGSTLWGANAVNGVVNIITKPAQETQGGLLTAGGGNQERGFGAMRFGGKAGADGYYRFFAQGFDREPFAFSTGQQAVDGWEMQRAGFRSDWKFQERDALTVQGDFYAGAEGDTALGVTSLTTLVSVSSNRGRVVGGNLLERWRHTFSDRSDTTVQFYYDRADSLETNFAKAVNTLDFDLQHHRAIGQRHDLIWGLGYRFIEDKTTNGPAVSFNPSDLLQSVYSSFVQDEIRLIPDRLYLTLGAKFEHNHFTGFEIGPSTRLAWTLHPRHLLWVAVSRAYRTPARNDSALRANVAAFRRPGPTTVEIAVLGNPGLRSEEVVATEAGYRSQLSRRLAMDLAGFVNAYDGLRARVPGAPFFETSPAPPHLVLPVVFQNALQGQTHGLELAPTWSVTGHWKLTGGYAWFQAHLHSTPAYAAYNLPTGVASPQHQWNLRSSLDLPGGWEFDTALYRVGPLPEAGVPTYTRLDTRFGWRPAESVELSLVGQDILDARHQEFGGMNEGFLATQVRRSFYARMTWRF